MTIDEAILGLQNEVIEAEDEGALDAVAYFKLGIEALKRIRRQRSVFLSGELELLPGETET